MKNVKEILKQGQEQLKKYNIDTSEARLLLAFVLNIDKTKIYCIEECDDSISDRFFECINKRCMNIPYAYITQMQEFMKLPFKVNNNVLIPRQDTEVLVENVVQIAKNINADNIKVLDMCTGSGCIAISIDRYINKANVVAVDISKEALEVAQINNQMNNTNVEFIQSNLFENLTDKEFDIIVSNPPYIPSEDITKLQKEVLHEPIIALDGGKDGLDIYRMIIIFSKEYLNENGYLILEIGFDQAKDIVELLKEEGYVNIEVIKDLANNDRVIKCRFLKR